MQTSASASELGMPSALTFSGISAATSTRTRSGDVLFDLLHALDSSVSGSDGKTARYMLKNQRARLRDRKKRRPRTLDPRLREIRRARTRPRL